MQTNSIPGAAVPGAAVPAEATVTAPSPMENFREAIQFLSGAATPEVDELRHAIRRIEGTVDYQPGTNPFSVILQKLNGYPLSIQHCCEAAESRWALARGDQ